MTETTPAMAHLCLLFFSPGITGSSSECVLFPACWNNFIYMCVCGGGGVQLLQSCPTLCDPMDCSPPGSSIHGIFQARILEWMAISSSRGSSQPRNQTHISCVSCIGRQILYHCITWEALSVCLNYAKAFDCVDNNKLWKILQEMGIPDHLTFLLRNLYAGQEATVRTGHGTTDWFQIGKGVHQGCILSPCLFNLYAKYIMRNAGLEETQAGIKIARRNINNLRSADDTTLMEESKEELMRETH